MPGNTRSIYVEIEIRGSMERVWELTQTPEYHRRWDLRFTEIEYLPRANDRGPQRFLYATRIGLGVKIRGEGESVGSHERSGGRRSSALKFWSEDPRSLIRSGSGYWRYVPRDEGRAVRFLTDYDYEVRFGAIGRLFDRLIFRPLMGWATAWSFDRLRLWVERGIEPAVAMRLSVVNWVARVALAMVWIYQGVAPKLIFRHADELAMLNDAGLPRGLARVMSLAAGFIEVGIGLVLLLDWRGRWPAWLTLVAMPVALGAVAVGSPRYLPAAFNPVSLNLATFALAVIALVVGRDLPSARNCLRRRTEGEP
jgi:uncharacterized membrane protein YphA (DoxX/SURF4 family)